MKDQSRFHGTNEYNNGHTFTGTLDKVAHYSAVLSGTTLDDLHEYMEYQWIDGDSNIFGTSANNTLQGTSADDSIWGLEGADVLYGKDCLDTLLGGDGADTFVFEADTAFNDIDIVADFSTSEGDKLDIADILFGYDELTDPITDFVEITTSGSNSILKVGADGGANNFVQIATLLGVTGLTDEEALETNGYLIAA